MNLSAKPVSFRAIAVLFGLLILAGCGPESAPTERSNIGGPVVDPDFEPRIVQLPLQEAPCTIHVEGIGDINIEEDYIPNVVACENGNAPMEALKAQAIQARGFIYYKLFVAGVDSVVNSEDDQVYQCSYASAQERHFEAARATRAEFLTWNEEIIAPFYVAGAIPADQSSGSPEDACKGSGGQDPTTTQQWVTYNLGRSGCNIDMSPLGWVPDNCHNNPHNRGCASQNGQTCLANRGWDYVDMLPYFYGDDIVINIAGGECGGSFEEPSAYDEHCAIQESDQWSCFDDNERILCDGDVADQVESCSHGCENGECMDTIEEAETYCESAEEGWHCTGGNWRILCEDEELTSTESCTAGCIDNECVPTGQSPQDDDESEGDPVPHTGEPTSLLTTSPGISGGCGQVPTSTTVPVTVVVTVALLSFLALRRRPLPTSGTDLR